MPPRFPTSAPVFLFRTPHSRFSPAISPLSYPFASARALSSTPRRAIKEDADRSAEQVEKKKQEQLDKQDKGEGHWHEELASHGESNIAADREKVRDHGEHIEDLQEQTKRKGEKGELE